jgi:hypothetical protein
MGEIFNDPITEITTIWEDNQSAIAYSHNALVSEEIKPIGLKWHFLKDHVEHGTIKSRYPPHCPNGGCYVHQNHYQDLHWQDTKVQSWKEQTQRNASSRSYL